MGVFIVNRMGIYFRPRYKKNTVVEENGSRVTRQLFKGENDIFGG